MKPNVLLSLLAGVAFLLPQALQGQDSAFTYQGQLRLAGAPFTGMADLEFRLYDQLTGGTQVGATQSVAGWPVEDGLFQVELDFGAGAFDGSTRFLEITVDGAPLAPRQKVTATPYALLASGLAAGSIGGSDIDPTEIQLRVVGTCPSGEFVQQINQDGSVACGTDTDSGGTLTQVDTGTGLTGGPITETGTISVDPAQVQRRVVGTCPAGEYLQSINEDGSAQCGTDADSGGTLTQVDTGAGLTGGPITETGTIAIAPGGVGATEIDSAAVQRRVLGDCPVGEYLQQINEDGSAVCSTDQDAGGTLTQVDTGTGLTGGPITDIGTIAIASGGVGATQIDPAAVQRRIRTACRAGEFLQRINEDGTAVCGIDRNTGGTLTRVDTGAGLTGGPITNAGTIAIAPGGVGLIEIDPAQVQRRVTGICPPATYLQTVFEDGTVGCGADAQGNDWRLGGNAGTNPATDFLGTIDATPLELRTANARTLRIEPSTELFEGLPNTANMIGGSRANLVLAGVRGATIAGGGLPDGESDGLFNGEAPNRVDGHFGVVSGGYGNTAGDIAEGPLLSSFATVGGGTGNTALGVYSTIGGGFGNVASEVSGTVPGGFLNEALDVFSTVGGGHFNFSSGNSSTVAGGDANTASGDISTVSGGLLNCAGGDRSWAGGVLAKVRPGTLSGDAGRGCDGVPSSGDDDGDEGTFVWADNQLSDFVSTGPHQFLVRASGGVGLGTSAPLAQLHVTEALNGSATPTNHVAIIENTAASTGNGPDVLALKTSAISPSATSNFITFFDGNDDAVGRIDGDGSGGVVLQSGGADFAEWLPKRDPEADIEPGDVVGWHADGISHDTEGALRVMVVSTRPIVAGNAPGDDESDAWVRIGFLGQVPVRIRGPVRAGDWIMASGRGDGVGTAMPTDDVTPGRLTEVVGRALETATEDGPHLVNVAIGFGQEKALGRHFARIDAENATLRERLAGIEQRHGEQIAALQARQRRELSALREELALLRAEISPRLAGRNP